MEETELMNPHARLTERQDKAVQKDRGELYSPSDAPNEAKKGVFVGFFAKK